MKFPVLFGLAAATVSGFSLSGVSHAGRSVQTYGTTQQIHVLQAATVAEDTTTDETEASESKSYLDDGFIFGLEGSGLERPKGKVSQVVVEGDSLETTPLQVAIVCGTFLGHTLIGGNALMEMFAANGGNLVLTLVQSLTLAIASWILADFGSGVLHFSVDNYGNGEDFERIY